MKSQNARALTLGLALLLVAFSSAAFADGKDDFLIGINSSGQLAFESEAVELEEIFSLPEVSGIINGWGGDDPGFMPLPIAEPKEDFFPLAIGAEIQLVVVSLDPAFKAHHPGFGDVMDGPGDAWTIATVTTDPPAFDDHPIWHIDVDDASLEANRVVWSAVFKFRDVGTTGYTESEPFVLRFSNADVEGCVTGDVNLDGFARRDDSCVFGDVLRNPGAFTPDEKCAADANQDGIVNRDDVYSFFRILASNGCGL